MKKFKYLLIPVIFAVCLAFVACTPPDGGDDGDYVELDDVKIELSVEDGITELSWQKVKDVEFTVYRADSRYGNYKEQDVDTSAQSFEDIERYGYYKVVAKDSSGKTLKTFENIGEELDMFGDNVLVITPDDNAASVNDRFTAEYNVLQNGEFSNRRFAALLKDGNYSDSINFKIGYYTTVSGLGQTPTAVSIKTIRVPNGFVGNACLNFWRGAENLSVRSDMMWAVSQGVYLRGINVNGNLLLSDGNGYASGGFLADSSVSGKVASGPQQQWLSRNCDWQSWDGNVWNMCFAGIQNAPTGTYPKQKYTVEQSTSLREKPFLTYDYVNEYRIAVPALRQALVGNSWKAADKGRIERYIQRDDIYFARADKDDAASINAAISDGMSVVFTPGIYTLDDPINVSNDNVVLLGLGIATLKTENGKPCLTVSGCKNVSVSGLLFDASAVKSDCMASVGTDGTTTKDIRLYDLSFRLGGATESYTATDTAIKLYADDSFIDNMWIWRADHGPDINTDKGVGWTVNEGDCGIKVYGDNVTAYGLMVEHFKKHNVEWYGENGKVFFYQCEVAYDVPSQADWMNGSARGYSSFHVDDAVDVFTASGVGVYSNFDFDVVLDSAVTVPDKPGVKLEHICTVHIYESQGGIANVVNSTGGGVGVSQGDPAECYLESYGA